MAKKKPETRRRTSRRWLILLVAVVALLAGGGIYLASRGPRPSAVTPSPVGQSDGAAQAAVSKKIILPAIPRRPRPQTLAPQIFVDPLIRKSYEVARDNPALLEQMPCYCGCYASPGHTNNLDCFADRHGET